MNLKRYQYGRPGSLSKSILENDFSEDHEFFFQADNDSQILTVRDYGISLDTL